MGNDCFVELSKLVHSEIFKRRRKCCIPLVFDSARQWPAAHFCVVTGRPAKPRACVLVIEGGEQHTKRCVGSSQVGFVFLIGRMVSPSPSTHRKPARAYPTRQYNATARFAPIQSSSAFRELFNSLTTL